MADETPGYLQPYERAVREHGAAWEAQLWRDPDAQRARFETLLEMIGIAPGSTQNARTVIGDVGCGRADLAAHLAERGFAPGGYVGVEGVPELAEEARRRAREGGWLACTVLDADFVADEGLPGRLVAEHGVTAVVFSGALNTLEQEAAVGVLGRFWDAIAPGGVLAFNFLCQRRNAPARVPGDPAVRFNSDALLAWALERCPDVRYRRDYLGALDASIAMRRPA